MSSHRDGSTICTNKPVVITGGSSGLGLELARRLVDEGARVTLMARNQAKLDEAAAELRQRRAGAHVGVVSVDVSSEADAQQAMQRAADDNGGIDLLAALSSTCPGGVATFAPTGPSVSPS